MPKICTRARKEVYFELFHHIQQSYELKLLFFTKKSNRFGICVLASDETGNIGILLMDRPIRLLFSKRVSDFEEEV